MTRRLRPDHRHDPAPRVHEFEPRLRHPGPFVLELYVTGMTFRSQQAILNILGLCEEHLKGRYSLEIVDIYAHPARAEGGQIIATPTLVRVLPEPQYRIVGDLSLRERVLRGLDLRFGP